jgi:hypothetical protein
MIGILTEPAYHDVVGEFFELFKTPWEPAVKGRRYRVVLATNDDVDQVNADVLFLFDAKENGLDQRNLVAGSRVY